MNRFIIAQFDISQVLSFFTVYAPGIWFRKLHLTDDEQLNSPLVTVLGGTFVNTLNETTAVGSFIVGNVALTKTNSLTELMTQQSSFYYDYDNQTIYIIFDDRNPYYIEASVKVGQSYSVANRASFNDGRFISKLGSLDLDVSLDESSLDDTQTADPIGEAKMTYDSFSFTFPNPDGRYDNLRQKIIGQGTRLLYAEKEGEILYSDLTIIRQGFVSDVSFTPSSVTVVGADPRSSWSMKINTETFTTEDYPSINETFINKRIPLVIGDTPAYSVPVVQITPTTFKVTSIKYGSSGTAIAVYLDGEQLTTGWSYDNLTGILTYSSYTSGELTIDLNPVNKGNLAETAIWAIGEFAGLSYITANFNIDECETAIDDSFSGSIYIGTSGMKLEDLIDSLMASNNSRLYPQNDVFTMRTIAERDPVSEIYQDDLIDIPASWSFDMDEYFSSITCMYKKKWSEDVYENLYDDSLKQVAINNNVIEKTSEIETLLTNEVDAQLWIDGRYPRAVLAPKVIKLTSISKINFKLLDTVIFTHNRLNKGEITPRANYEVVELSYLHKTVSLKYLKENPSSNTWEDVFFDFENNEQSLSLDFENNDQLLFIDFKSEETL